MVTSLTNNVYTPWGKSYQKFRWNADWNIFIKIAERERKTSSFKDTKSVNHIIYWFDTEVLQKINTERKVTLDVRIRIVCGMVNKVLHTKLSWELKQRFMQCIWDAYQEFSRDYIEYNCRYILKLPF